MDRQQAHQLLDQLSPTQLDAVANLLEVMVREDDDEDLTEEDRTPCRQAPHQGPVGA